MNATYRSRLSKNKTLGPSIFSTIEPAELKREQNDLDPENDVNFDFLDASLEPLFQELRKNERGRKTSSPIRKSTNFEHPYGIDYEEDQQKKEKAKESKFLYSVTLSDLFSS